MNRAKLKYLFFGGATGWLLGYLAALGSNGWYFATPATVLTCSIVGAIFSALLYNGLMMVEGYSNRLRYGVTGGLLGYIVACIGGFVYIGGLDMTRISFQNGLVFDWALIHCAIIIGIIGFLIGSRADKRLSHSIE